MSAVPRQPAGAHVVVVGAGNIASHFVPHVARMKETARLTIIDRDCYEERNLTGQAMMPADVRKPKAVVQARRAQAINPRLAVGAIHAPVETIPPGRLAGDVIVAGLDNRKARQHINEVAWLLGIPWIDAAVEAQGLQVRVGVYTPGEDKACLECGWNDADYEALTAAYPCLGHERPPGGAGADSTPPTDAPAALGALAAALQAVECAKLLRHEAGAHAGGRQLFFDLRHHQYYASTLPRNPACRRSHAVPAIQMLAGDPREITLGRFLSRAAYPTDEDAAPGTESVRPTMPLVATDLFLRVRGARWVRRMVCSRCGASRARIRLLHGSPLAVTRRCPRCRGTMRPSGFHMSETLPIASLSPRQHRRALHALGIRAGDILSLESDRGSPTHFRITCDAA